MSRPMKRDPALRDDGLCARWPECEKPRREPTGKYISRAEFQSDPFCSSECCRIYHGCNVVKPTGVRYSTYVAPQTRRQREALERAVGAREHAHGIARLENSLERRMLT